jgi:hypothetical protein
MDRFDRFACWLMFVSGVLALLMFAVAGEWARCATMIAGAGALQGLTELWRSRRRSPKGGR